MNWFQRLFERQPCQNCDTLRQLLETEKFEKNRLLNQFVFVTKEELVKVEEKPHEPIPPRFIPFRVQKELLEAESREKVRIMAAMGESKSIEELEKTVGIDAN